MKAVICAEIREKAETYLPIHMWTLRKFWRSFLVYDGWASTTALMYSGSASLYFDLMLCPRNASSHRPKSYTYPASTFWLMKCLRVRPALTRTKAAREYTSCPLPEVQKAVYFYERWVSGSFQKHLLMSIVVISVTDVLNDMMGDRSWLVRRDDHAGEPLEVRAKPPRAILLLWHGDQRCVGRRPGVDDPEGQYIAQLSCIFIRFAAEYRYGGTANGASFITRISYWMKSVYGHGPVSSNTAAWSSRVSLNLALYSWENSCFTFFHNSWRTWPCTPLGELVLHLCP